MRQTGVHGLMYARGALRNPAIFSDHLAPLAGEKPSVMTKKDMAKTIIRHMQLISQSCTHEETIFPHAFYCAALCEEFAPCQGHSAKGFVIAAVGKDLKIFWRNFFFQEGPRILFARRQPVLYGRKSCPCKNWKKN